MALPSALPKITNTLIILGECVPCLKQGASKFKIKRLELDINIHMVIIMANRNWVMNSTI